MQIPNQSQWWSNLLIQSSHTAQCEHLGGRNKLQVTQKIIFCKWPFITQRIFPLNGWSSLNLFLSNIPGSVKPPFKHE